ncbi:hypothetical protein A9K55_006178 [Cordyceps militaris]|uniref:Uncharacterized protein n=1 Tax=Cordyceps militaris TaxID=73501 RepID=A0A2H4SB85_CORMI|nr:hypothetical protein A9K55_006178 [Cordyceps militaris]
MHYESCPLGLSKRRRMVQPGQSYGCRTQLHIFLRYNIFTLISHFRLEVETVVLLGRYVNGYRLPSTSLVKFEIEILRQFENG